ncbi:MAG: aminodeoxychorismate synthase component I [Candidatus Eisenbacteria bacterium]
MPARPELPLVQLLETDRPLAPLRQLAGLPHPFLLHSSLPDAAGAGTRRARWSFFGAEPFAVLREGDHESAIRTFRRFAASAPQAGAEHLSGVPFTGGAVGYWAYDYGRRLERWTEDARDDLGLPDFCFALYDVVGAYDHDSAQMWLFSSGLPFTGDDAMARAQERLERFRVRMLGPGRAPASIERPGLAPAPQGTHTFESWKRGVLAVQEHIRRGDIFQANLTQRWRIEHPAALALAPALYEALVQHSPAPYSAYLDCGDHALLSASPERFLELRGQHVETRPIKGTRPRGATPEADAALAAELLASAKDRAENVMIVDVLRNDLGRVCDTGTVEAARVCELETFAQVHHLTSTVTGRLREGLDAFDLLHACFPGGSITGAPKLRAIEILDQLEPVRRHAYTGAIGWLGWNGDADWSIAIRTATATANSLVFAAGGGITADSDPEAEYHESHDKAEGMRAAFSSVLGRIDLENGGGDGA